MSWNRQRRRRESQRGKRGRKRREGGEEGRRVEGSRRGKKRLTAPMDPRRVMRETRKVPATEGYSSTADLAPLVLACSAFEKKKEELKDQLVFLLLSFTSPSSRER